MTNRRLIAGAVAVLAAAALTGCPSLRVGQVRLAAPPKGGKLTLQVDVDAKNSFDKEEVSGEAVVGIWLPPGWKVTAIHLSPPAGGESGNLSFVPELAPAFPTTFPHREGEWWPFVTGVLRLAPEESAVFPFAVDIEGPAKGKALVLGLALGAISDCEVKLEVGREVEMDPPTEIAVDLRKGTVAVRENPARVDTQLPGCVKRPAPDAGLEDDAGTEPDACVRQCAELPVYGCDCPECPPPVERGPRGCSCDNPGDPRPAPGLLGLLIGLVS
jgi:hypothetical protein